MSSRFSVLSFSEQLYLLTQTAVVSSRFDAGCAGICNFKVIFCINIRIYFFTRRIVPHRLLFPCIIIVSFLRLTYYYLKTISSKVSLTVPEVERKSSGTGQNTESETLSSISGLR